TVAGALAVLLGTPLQSRDLGASRWFWNDLPEAGAPMPGCVHDAGVRLHDPRHTHATLMLKEGVPVKVVSERLGHSSVAFTMQVYQHVLPGMQADAAKRFDDTVFGG